MLSMQISLSFELPVLLVHKETNACNKPGPAQVDALSKAQK